MHARQSHTVLVLVLFLCSFEANAFKPNKEFESSVLIQKFTRFREPLEDSSNEDDFSWIDDALQSVTIVTDNEDNKDIWSELEDSGDFNKFAWRDCSNQHAKSASAANVRVLSLSIAPIPIHLPGLLNISFTANVTGNIESPLQAEVHISKKIGPAYVHVKTVQIPQVCEKLDKKTCPKQFPRCHCPFSESIYEMPLTSFNIKLSQKIPSGDYKVTTRLLQPEESSELMTKKDTQEIGCIFVELSMK